MNFLDTMLGAMGITASEGATDEAKCALMLQNVQAAKQQMTAATVVFQKLGAKTPEEALTAVATMQGQAEAGAALIAKLGAKTGTDALAVLASMVPRADLNAVEETVKKQDVQLVLLEGQMSGKLTMADCEAGKGWAHNAASQSPAVLRGMLPNLPTKVATGQSIASVVAGLQIVTPDKVVEGAAQTITVGTTKFALTDITKDYDAAERENLMDLASRNGVEKLVKAGYLKVV